MSSPKDASQDSGHSDHQIQILLAEYQAIEHMHAHYDVLNMSMSAFITAGVFALWGIVVQAAFQPHMPVDDPSFANLIFLLSLSIFAVLSVWIRYTTIHRCIVIQKLDRSHEIEEILRMKQNSIFKYVKERLIIPIEEDDAKRRPGGHTLELLLYFTMSTLGCLVALYLQWHSRPFWGWYNFLFFAFLLLLPLIAILWMTFCKFDATTHMKGLVSVGLPWSYLFPTISPISRFLRGLLNFRQQEV